MPKDHRNERRRQRAHIREECGEVDEGSLTRRSKAQEFGSRDLGARVHLLLVFLSLLLLCVLAVLGRDGERSIAAAAAADVLAIPGCNLGVGKVLGRRPVARVSDLGHLALDSDSGTRCQYLALYKLFMRVDVQ